MPSQRAPVKHTASRYEPYCAPSTSHLPRAARLSYRSRLSALSGPSQSSSTAPLSALTTPTTAEAHQDAVDWSSRRATVVTAAAPSRRAPCPRSSDAVRPSRSSQPSSSTGNTYPLAIPTTEPGQDVRDICQQMVDIAFPGFRPRNDFELITLATRKYPGARADLGAWLDQQLAWAIQQSGSLETVLHHARTALHLPSSCISGLKPRRTEQNVFLRPLSDSPYSIRLYPGCALAGEYCMDFVETATGLPVNSPFKFELWGVPDSGPCTGLGSSRRIISLDRMFGVRQKDILPGHEKFLLKDGQTCLLRRPGHKDVRFKVPKRLQPASRAAQDVDEWDLPTAVAA